MWQEIKRGDESLPTLFLMDVKGILQGWGRLLFRDFDSLDPEVQERAKTRMQICDQCPIRQGSTCDSNTIGKHVVTGQLVKGCGCQLRAKVLASNSKCPFGKW